MTLYIVPVPIGNLGDITLRAIEVLSEVDFLVAEDTRHSMRLLNHLGIKKPMMSYYRPREKEKSLAILKRLKNETAALISDSGTPGISDPGYILIRGAIENNITVVPLPGPTAFVPALCASGLPVDQFLFIGFPPRRAGELEKMLRSLSSLPFTMVFYESPRRTRGFLESAFRVLGARPFAMARELTKRNESLVRGRLDSYLELLENETMRGEVVLMVSGKPSGEELEPKVMIRDREDILRVLEERFNVNRADVRAAWMRKSE